MNILICDDNKEVLEYISDVIVSHSTNCRVIKCIDYDSALKYINNEKIDVLIMDIVLDKNTGIDLVKDNVDKLSNTQVIYITGYDDYIEECFETNLIYILRKPINEDKLLLALNKALNNLSKENKSIVLKVGKENKRVNIKDINYVESEGRKIKFNLGDEVITVYGKISDIEDDLGKLFVRVHKSYLVNMDRIVNYTINKVELNNGKVLPISRSYIKSCREIIYNYLRDSE